MSLRQALRYQGIQSSAFACRIVAHHLFHECLELNKDSPDDDSGELDEAEFWIRHQNLDEALTFAFLSLPEHLRSVDSASVAAVTINIQLHLASICIHRAGSAVVKRRNETIDAFWRTQSRLIPAAQQIFIIVAVIGDINTRFRNPFVPFASFMAASVFLEHYLLTRDVQSEERLNAMMALMISVGKNNAVTASLAVQLAQQVKASGIDPSALDKVCILAAIDVMEFSRTDRLTRHLSIGPGLIGRQHRSWEATVS